MPDHLVEAGSPVKMYVKQMLAQIETAINEQDYVFAEPVRFNLQTVVEKKKGGGLDLKVLQAGANVNESNVQNVSFAIQPKSMNIVGQKLVEALTNAFAEDAKKKK